MAEGLKIGGVRLPLNARQLAIVGGAAAVVLVGQRLASRSPGAQAAGAGIQLSPADFLGIIQSTSAVAAGAAGQGASAGASLGSSGLGAGAQLGLGGLELAGRAVDALERNADTATNALARVSESTTDALVSLVSRSPVYSSAPPPSNPLTLPPVAPAYPVAGPVAAPTAQPVVPVSSYPAPPDPIARYYPTSAALATAIRSAAIPNGGKTAIKLVTGEWIYV